MKDYERHGDAINRVSTCSNNNNIKFRGQYRTKSTRLPDYDYGQNGAYFVTICTEKREHFLGSIIEDKMLWSDIGIVVNNYWQQIPQQFSFVVLGEWVIMPNHMHGILVFDDHNNRRDAIYRVSGDRISKEFGGITKHKNPMLKQNLSSIIRWFKGKTTFEIRKTCPMFAWQTRFYEHVIRNEKDYNTVTEYIIFNPQNWKNDTNFS
jgi:putative transposase